MSKCKNLNTHASVTKDCTLVPSWPLDPMHPHRVVVEYLVSFLPPIESGHELVSFLPPIESGHELAQTYHRSESPSLSAAHRTRRSPDSQRLYSGELGGP